MASKNASMNISLPPPMRAYVESIVAEGDYASASAVVQDALRLFQRERELHQQKVRQLEADLALGLEDVASGRTLTLEESNERLKLRRQEWAGLKKGGQP